MIKTMIKSWGNDIKTMRVERVEVWPPDVKHYLHNIIPREMFLNDLGIEQSRPMALGTYCENCGILQDKPVMYFTYYVCDGCLRDLKKERETMKQVSAPNLNDLIFGCGRE